MSALRAVGALARACHPEPVLAVTLISTSLAFAAGLGWRSVVVCAAVFTGQLSIGWCNDYLDRDRDRAARRTDKPVALGLVSSSVVGVAALVALVVCVPLSLVLGWRAALAHLLLVGGGWVYNFFAKASVLSVVPYLVAFGALPSIVTLAASSRMVAPLWATAGGALLGASAHFTNTLPDLDDDAVAGIRGLPHRLGKRGSLIAAVLLLAAACIVLAFAPPGGLDVVAAVLLANAAASIAGIVIAAGRAGSSRDAFRFTVLTAVLAVALLLIRGNQLT